MEVFKIRISALRDTDFDYCPEIDIEITSGDLSMDDRLGGAHGT